MANWALFNVYINPSNATPFGWTKQSNDERVCHRPISWESTSKFVRNQRDSVNDSSRLSIRLWTFSDSNRFLSFYLFLVCTTTNTNIYSIHLSSSYSCGFLYTIFSALHSLTSNIAIFWLFFFLFIYIYFFKFYFNLSKNFLTNFSTLYHRFVLFSLSIAEYFIPNIANSMLALLFQF